MSYSQMDSIKLRKQLVKEYLHLLKLGMGKRQAVLKLVPKFELSEGAIKSYIWKELNKNAPNKVTKKSKQSNYCVGN